MSHPHENRRPGGGLVGPGSALSQRPAVPASSQVRPVLPVDLARPQADLGAQTRPGLVSEIGALAAKPAPVAQLAQPLTGAAQTRPETAVPTNVNVPAALATPNVPLASPQAVDRRPGGVPLAPSQQPAAIAPVAPSGGGIAGNIRALVQRAQAGQASQRSTSFGRQNTDGINPRSLF